jgi:hypothetical protein
MLRAFRSAAWAAGINQLLATLPMLGCPDIRCCGCKPEPGPRLSCDHCCVFWYVCMLRRAHQVEACRIFRRPSQVPIGLDRVMLCV